MTAADAEMKVRFPQYAPAWKETRDGYTVTLVSVCPRCGESVTERTWIRVDDTPIDNSILHQQAKEDGDQFTKHFIRQHGLSDE